MKKLQNTLSQINALGIQHSDDLKKEENLTLYHELYVNISNFITEIVFRSKKNQINLMRLCKDFGIELSDIHMDCLIRALEKLDKILARDTAFQIPYLYTMCNRVIIDTYRQTIRHYHVTVSLNETLASYEANADSRKSKCLEDRMMDKKANTEINFITKEAVLEIFEKYAGNADSLLCAISSRIFGDKPRELAWMLLQTGSVDAVLEEYIDNMCLSYHICKSELPVHTPAKALGISKVLFHLPPEKKAFKGKEASDEKETLEEKEAIKKLACKISNITNRVNLPSVK